jgi:hypothetical protein
VDWTQTLTIIATVIGAVFAFYKLTLDEIIILRENMSNMDTNHRDDMKMWAALFEKFHILDKDMEKFKVKFDSNNKNK